ncbi:MAG: autotransporter-associated beta strand repeat-containing protein [Nibricoccus sp.]
MHRFTSTLLAFITLAAAALTPLHAQRQMENLGRGVVAVRTTNTEAYIGWRLLATDPGDIAFNLYRTIGSGSPAKINGSPLNASTNFRDTLTSLDFSFAITYQVIPVVGGIEQPAQASTPFTIAANAVSGRQYLAVPLATATPNPASTYPYDVKFAWVGDLDGDGEYDFVVDRLSTNPNAEEPQFLEAYKRDGTFLWRMAMGPNSVNQYAYEPGSSAISIGDTDNVTVYDLDGDGRAEVAVRTANGVTVTNAAGTQVAAITAASNTDQFVSIIDGLTGVERARAPLPNPWAQFGTLTNKCAIGYFDGSRPSVLFYGYNREDNAGDFHRVFTAFDFRNNTLSQRWTWAQTGPGAEGHQIRIADVDNDGRDEVCDIGHVIDDNGTQLFYTELTHGDRFHIGDLNPNWPGLETYAIQQNNPSLLATAYYSSDTGVMFKKWYAPGIVDVGRGIALDMDPNYYGSELYSTQPGIFDANGTKIFTNNIWAPEGLWWDGDLSREFLDGAGSGALSPVVNKFNPATGNADRIYTIYSDNGGVHQAFGGRAAFWGDILGDWREEIVLVNNSFTELRIYTTTISAPNRLYTLMQNPQYRTQATTKGYVQSSYVDYHLGTGMTPPPPAPIATAKLFWQGGAGAANTWSTSTAAWREGLNGSIATNFVNGDSVLFEHTGNNTSPILLSGSLTPSAVTVFSATDYIFDGTNGSISGSTTLTKVGAGVLTLTGSHAFTGTTTVWDGALRVDGQLMQSPVTIWGGTWGGPRAGGATGGRLAGTGTVSQPVTIAYRGSITPGTGMNNAGTLTLAGGATTQSASTFAFDLSDDPTGLTKANDRLAITGNLTLSGDTTIFINLLDPQLSAGTYTLVTYTGTLTGAANLKFSGLDGIPYTYSTSGGAITLTVPTVRPVAALAWQGGAGAQWDLVNTPAWLRDGTTTDGFVPGDTVTFDATGASTPTVNIPQAVNPLSVTVSANANYTFTGIGSITGNASLTKSGTGTLAIETINSFTGPVAINGGAIAFNVLSDGGVAGPLGASSSNASNLVLNGGALRMTGSESTSTNRDITLAASGGAFDVTTSGVLLQLSGEISGPGQLTKTGPGTVILASPNSYAGGTVINNGTLTLASAAANRFALGSGPVTLNNGTLTMTNVQNFGTVCAWNIIVPAGASGRLDADGRCDLTGSLTGSGNFTFYTPFVRTELIGDWSAFTGKILAITDADGGDLRFRNSAGIPNAELNLGANTYTYWAATLGSDITVPIGALSGVSTANFRGSSTAGRTITWSIGGKNLDTTFPGAIANNTGPAAITKVGTGTLTLTGTNTYTGATTVSNGTLLLNGTSGGSAFTVQSGAMLGGTGTITGAVNFQSGSRLLANITNRLNVTGTASFAGTITVVSPVAISDGSYTLLSATSIADTASFTYSGPLASGQVASFSTAGGNLVVTFANLNGRSPGATTWTGVMSDTWDGPSVNWKLDVGGSPTNFVTGDFVKFTDALVANPTISIPNAVAPLSVTFNNATTVYTLNSANGGISGSATLAKSGAGTAILNGANTYTGATSVTAGNLLLNGASASSATTVSSGAAFGGNSTVTGNVTFQSGSRILVHTGGPLVVNGTLTLPASIAIHSAVNVPDGTYTVLSGAALPSATWSYSGPLYIGQTAAISANATAITLTLSGTVSTRGPSPIKWSGATSAVWSTAVLNNWKLPDNTATPYANADSVTFDDSLTANPAITLAQAATPATVTAANNATAYSLTSSNGGISGATSFVKNGTGTFTLTGANAYTGGTIVNSGILAMGNKDANNTALGSGPITLNGGTLRFFYTNNVNATPTVANAWIVPAGANGRVQFDQRTVISGALTGSGTLTIWIPYVRTDLNGNWSAFTGQLNVTADLAANGDALLGDGGDFRIGNTAGYPNARVDLANGVYGYYNVPPAAGVNIAFGSLSGASGATLAGTSTAGRTATWTVGALNLNTTYAGRIINGTGPSAVVKVGAGTLTLSGNNTYTGTTVVNAGTLALTGVNTFSGATTINAGTLALSGSLSNASTVEVKSGATLHLTGTLTTGTLTIRAGGKLTGGGTINATVINEGLISADAANFLITGNLTNAASGTIRLTRGAGLTHSGGTFTNNGLLDLISAGPTNLVIAPGTNVLDASVLRGTLVWTPGNPATLTMTAWVGHNYQLQRTTDLVAGTWESIGTVIQGDGSSTAFTDPTPPAVERLFYRILVDQ